MSKYVPMSAEAAFADIEAIMGSDESALEKTKKLCDKGTVCYDNNDDIPAAAYYDEALATGVLTDDNLYEIQFRCGVSYAEHDGKKSVDMLKKAAEGGHVKAMLNLAVCYLRGKGTAKNEKECFAWAQKAAEMGDVEAMYLCAVCLEDGVGTAKDDTASFVLMKRAAEGGIVDAMYKTAINHDRGNGTFPNPKEAFEWFKNAAEMGHPDAMHDLGACYANGEGTVADPSEAFRWMKL